jgi:hypothetical protein
MKDVKLEFDGYWIDVENGWLCMGDDENQVLLKPEYFKKLLEAINYTRCCTELNDDIKFERKSSARVFNNEKGIWEFI